MLARVALPHVVGEKMGLITHKSIIVMLAPLIEGKTPIHKDCPLGYTYKFPVTLVSFNYILCFIQCSTLDDKNIKNIS